MARKLVARSATASFGVGVGIGGITSIAEDSVSTGMTATVTMPAPAVSVQSAPTLPAAGTSEAITVGMRLRPLIGYEKDQAHCITIDGDVVSIDGNVTGGVSQKFAFDFAMDSTDPESDQFCGQAECYEKMGKRMLNHMLNGFHTCLFCYGQTGTGKTTTIMGKREPRSEQGLLLRLIADIYDEVARQKAQGLTVSVKVQMLEVYNERLNDLLCSDPAVRKKQKVDVRVHPEVGVYVMGATTAACESAEACLELIDFGNTVKTVHATAMNAHSSRGHTVFKLELERRGGDDHQIITSEVYFADLAGRENERTTQVTGDRLSELTFINRSLMWLANCINSLGAGREGGRRMTVSGTLGAAPKRDMAKFRNSKLTLLLSNALSGNSRTAMIGTLSPAVANFEESFSTLKFAKTVKNIKLEAKAATAVDKETLVQKLQQEVRDLKRQLEEAHQNRDEFGTQDLTDRLTITGEILEASQKTEGRWRHESQEQARMRSSFMERYGVMRKSLSTGFHEAPKLPYIAQYHDDPYLAFLVHSHIPPDGVERCLGHGDHVDVSLPAWMGVAERTAVIRNYGDRLFLNAVQLSRASGKITSIEVNGKLLTDTRHVELQHLDCIVFGRSLTYYVFKEECQPDAVINRIGHQERMKAMFEPELTEEEVLPALRETLGEERAYDKIQLEVAKQYWKYQQSQHYDAAGRKAMNQWLHEAKQNRLLVNDANEITESLRPGYCFELVATAPVLSFGRGGTSLPEFAVQLMFRTPRQRLQKAVNKSHQQTFCGVVREAAQRQGLFFSGGSSGSSMPPPGGRLDKGGDRDEVESFEGISSSGGSESSSTPTGSPGPTQHSPSGGGAAYMESSRWSMGRVSLSSEDGGGRLETVALWSWSKFKQRLDLMYELKQEWEHNKDFVLTARNDAWAEHGPAEITELQVQAEEQLRDAKAQLMEANAEIQRLRDSLLNLPGSLLSPVNGTNGHNVQVHFAAADGADGVAAAIGGGSPVPARSAFGQAARCLDTSKSNMALLESLVRRISGTP